MGGRSGSGLGSALGWILIPILPVILENTYNGVLVFWDTLPRDPHDWDFAMWVMQLGPLIGFGFLAGATIRLPDPEGLRRGPRGWIARRSVWVTIGPWLGGLVCAAIFFAASFVERLLGPLAPKPPVQQPAPQGVPFGETWIGQALFLGALGFIAYGWFVPAVAAVLRAKRRGSAWNHVRRGLAVSAAFVGSLFGSFWAITEGWRTFFFDPRIMPLWIAAAGLTLASGCAQTLTYGEVRRRELFHAMLLAWMFGLAVLWRWWSRKRRSS